MVGDDYDFMAKCERLEREKRNLVAALANLKRVLSGLRPRCCLGPCEAPAQDRDDTCHLTRKIDAALG